MALYDRVQQQCQSKTRGRLTRAHIRYSLYQWAGIGLAGLQRSPSFAVVICSLRPFPDAQQPARCCVCSPHCRHSLHTLNLMTREFTQCGTNLPFFTDHLMTASILPLRTKSKLPLDSGGRDVWLAFIRSGPELRSRRRMFLARPRPYFGRKTP